MAQIKFLSPLATPEDEKTMRINIANAKRQARAGDIAKLYEAYVRYGKLYQEHNDEIFKKEMIGIEDYIKNLPVEKVMEAVQRAMDINDFAPARWLATLVRRESMVNVYKKQIADEILHEVSESEIKEEINERLTGQVEGEGVIIGIDPGNQVGWAAVNGNVLLGQGSIGSRDVRNLCFDLSKRFNPDAWVFEVADNRLEYGPIKVMVNTLATIISRQESMLSWRQGLEIAKSQVRLVDAQKMRYVLEKYFNDKMGLTGKDQIRLRRKDQIQGFIQDYLNLGEMSIHAIDAFIVAWCYFVFHGSRVEDRFVLSRRQDVEGTINKWNNFMAKVRREKFSRQKRGYLNKKIKEAQNRMLESPDIIIEPMEPFIKNVVDKIKAMAPGYFKGVSKVVVRPHYAPGHVESGPGKDPNIIYIDKTHLDREVRRVTGKGLAQVEQFPNSIKNEIYKAMARVIFHEKGHILGFKPSKGYASEYEAEQEATKMLGKGQFPKSAKLKWPKGLSSIRYSEEERKVYSKVRRMKLDEIRNILRNPLDDTMAVALSRHPSVQVRKILAKKPSLPHKAIISLRRDPDQNIRKIMDKNLRTKYRSGLLQRLSTVSLEEVNIVNEIKSIVGNDNIRYIGERKIEPFKFSEIYKDRPEVFEWIKETIGDYKGIVHDFEVRNLSGDWLRAEYFGYDESRFVEKRYEFRKLIKEHFFDMSGKNVLSFVPEDLKNKNNLLQKLREMDIIDKMGKAFEVA